MDPEKKNYYIILAACALCLIIMIVIILWQAYHALVVKNDLFEIFTGTGRHSLFTTLGMFILMLVVTWGVYTKKIPTGSGPKDPPAMPTGAAIMEDRDKKNLYGIPSGVINYGIAIFMGVFLVGLTYGTTRSLPFTVIMFGIVLAFYGIAGHLAPTAWGFVFFLMVIVILFPVILLAGYTTGPGFTPDQLLPRIIAQPFGAIFAVLLLAFPVYSWVSTNGIPFLRPLTDEDLKEPCKKEFVLNLPFEKTFEVCRDSLQNIPNVQVNSANPLFGTISAYASPGWGRTSLIQFTLEQVTDQRTRVKIDIISPLPSGENEPRKRTYVNEKYMDVLTSYITPRF